MSNGPSDFDANLQVVYSSNEKEITLNKACYDSPNKTEIENTPLRLVRGTVEELLRVNEASEDDEDDVHLDASKKKIRIQVIDTLVGENDFIMYWATAVAMITVPDDSNKAIDIDSNDNNAVGTDGNDKEKIGVILDSSSE